MRPLLKFAVPEDRATPGTIDVRQSSDGRPTVINCFAQWEMGKPGKYNRVSPAPNDSEQVPAASRPPPRLNCSDTHDPHRSCDTAAGTRALVCRLPVGGGTPRTKARIHRSVSQCIITLVHEVQRSLDRTTAAYELQLRSRTAVLTLHPSSVILSIRRSHRFNPRPY